MSAKSLYLALPLAAGLLLTGCSGSGTTDAPASPSSAPQATASTPTPAAAAGSSSAAASAPTGSAAASPTAPPTASKGAANGASLTDAQLKKVVTEFFKDTDGAQILAGEKLRSQVGAAGQMVQDTKVTPEKCFAANGVDLEAELEKNNLAVGAVANPEDPTQSITLTVMSAGDPAAAQATFDEGTKALDDCSTLEVETMGVKATVAAKEATVQVDASSALALETVTTAQGTKVPGASILLLEDGSQVQLQIQGKELDKAGLQDVADQAQHVLDRLKGA